MFKMAPVVHRQTWPIPRANTRYIEHSPCIYDLI